MKKYLSLVVLLLLVPSLTFASFDVSLKYGSKGDLVVDLQDFLTDQGAYAGKLDGRFGLGTLKSVKAWQTSVGLFVDGYFGKGSRAKANDILASLLQDSNTTETTETGGIGSPSLDGCTSTEGYSISTGQKCDGTVSNQVITNSNVQNQLNNINNTLNTIAENTTPPLTINVPPAYTPPMPELTIVEFGQNDFPTVEVNSTLNSYPQIHPTLSVDDVGYVTQVNEIWINFNLKGIVLPNDKITIVFNNSTKEFNLEIANSWRQRNENSIIGATFRNPQGNDWSYNYGHSGKLDFAYDTEYPYTISLQRGNRIATQSGMVKTNSSSN